MSCLFHSLAHFVGTDANAVRAHVCDYLAANRPLMEDLDTAAVLCLDAPSAEAYVVGMRDAGTWGGAVEIQAACNIWSLRIIVAVQIRGSRQGERIEFVPVATHPTRTVCLRWNGGHFTPGRVEQE